MKTKFTVLLLLAFSFVNIIAQEATTTSRRQPRPYNPEQPQVHDPVMIKQGDTYYLFATGRGITVMTSRDMLTWNLEEPVFSESRAWVMEYLPEFRGHIWAPDIIYYQGKYHIFYSCSAFAKNTSVIGHASTTTLDRNDPAFGWTDHGLILQSVPYRDMWNAIDPNIIVDEKGTPWMNFGSFWDGIKLVKLTDDLSAIAKPEEWYSISRRERTHTLDDNDPGDGAVEAPFIMEHGGYYYLLVSFDYCCRGLKSDYKIVVGRSRAVEGPYMDKEGISMAVGGGTLLMEGNQQWVGVGHCAAYSFDDGDYLIAHGYDNDDEGVSKLIIRKMFWSDDGWPEVQW